MSKKLSSFDKHSSEARQRLLSRSMKCYNANRLKKNSITSLQCHQSLLSKFQSHVLLNIKSASSSRTHLPLTGISSVKVAVTAKAMTRRVVRFVKVRISRAAVRRGNSVAVSVCLCISEAVGRGLTVGLGSGVKLVWEVEAALVCED